MLCIQLCVKAQICRKSEGRREAEWGGEMQKGVKTSSDISNQPHIDIDNNNNNKPFVSHISFAMATDWMLASFLFSSSEQWQWLFVRLFLYPLLGKVDFPCVFSSTDRYSIVPHFSWMLKQSLWIYLVIIFIVGHVNITAETGPYSRFVSIGFYCCNESRTIEDDDDKWNTAAAELCEERNIIAYIRAMRRGKKKYL